MVKETADVHSFLMRTRAGKLYLCVFSWWGWTGALKPSTTWSSGLRLRRDSIQRHLCAHWFVTLMAHKDIKSKYMMRKYIWTWISMCVCAYRACLWAEGSRRRPSTNWLPRWKNASPVSASIISSPLMPSALWQLPAIVVNCHFCCIIKFQSILSTRY